jgi:mycoredoxin-dependent peroxiredoxin
MTASTAPVANVPRAGTAAPDFTLPTTSGKSVTLSGLRGQTVLLAFFPLAFTSTCTAEFCSMRDDYDAFRERGVTIVPISVDSIPTLKEYREKYGMQTELASDFKREVSRLYGVLNEDKFYANRSYFLIDGHGIVRWSHVEEQNGMRRENTEIFEQIDLLRE